MGEYMTEELQRRIRAAWPDYKTAAEAIGISPQHMSRLINGKQPLREAMKHRIEAITPEVLNPNVPDMEWLQKSVELLVREAYNRGRQSVITLAEVEDNRLRGEA